MLLQLFVDNQNGTLFHGYDKASAILERWEKDESEARHEDRAALMDELGDLPND